MPNEIESSEVAQAFLRAMKAAADKVTQAVENDLGPGHAQPWANVAKTLGEAHGAWTGRRPT